MSKSIIKDFGKTAIITKEQEISYSELLQRISLFAQHTPQGHDKKTIVLSENREGWLYAFFAVWNNRGIAVPVDATSTVHDIAYILKDCTPQCIWTSQNLLPTAQEAAREAGVEVEILLIDDYEKADCSLLPKAEIECQEEDTALIIYTSGTTGSPKGVMLSYRNLWANMAGVSEEVPIITKDRRVLILLPLHHVLPLMGTVIIPIIQGGGVAICPTLSGPDIMDTLCRGQIGVMIGVPRLWQTLYNGIKKKIDAKWITRMLFALCAKVQSRKLSRLIFSSIRKKMGGHLDYCVSGGAALDKEIGEGLRTLGLDVLEGYGMTETAPIIAFTRPGDIIPGCVGLPLPSVECKLVNGELCAKGKNLMQGYYNRPEETAAVIDQDGFIHTGDLATIDEKGRVYITGRCKEIIVLSNGKNVQPNEIEYKLEKYQDRVKEAAIVQDGDLLRAIIVPDPVWASTLNDEQVEENLKREVLEPYNQTVANYKKVMSVMVYRGDLPRTKMEKLQRFKLKDILAGVKPKEDTTAQSQEPQMEEYQILKKYIEGEKNLTVKATDHIETDLAMDSLDKVALQGFIEEKFGMKVAVEEMSAFRNIEAMAKHIAEAKTQTSDLQDLSWNALFHMETSQLDIPAPSSRYPLLACSFKCILKLYNRLSIKGRENIPAEGPFIIAPNHQSFLDGPIVAAGLDKKTLCNSYSFATEEHVQGKRRRNFARRNNIIIMERSNLKTSILKLAEVLKQGKNVIIFPEGSRTHTGKLGSFKKTFAILSRELQVPIVPVCISGAYEALPRSKKMVRPHKITVSYLKPILPTAEQSYEDIAEAVKKAIEKELKK